MKRVPPAIAVLILAILYSQPTNAGELRTAQQKCLLCHGRVDFKKVDETGKVNYLFVDEVMLKKSAHGKKECSDCHADVTEIPHKTAPKRVNCTKCHYKGNPEGAPQSEKYLEYQASVHGRAYAAGRKNAPGCRDCHGSHDIMHRTEPGSKVSRMNLAKTCGRCHLDEYNQYMESVHGDAAYAKGIKEAPVCSSCHGEHNIIEHSDPRSSVYRTNVPGNCSHCHAEEKIVGKYGVNSEQVKTFDRSFHGVAIKYGSKTVANCASCHGVHNIRKPDDPKSSVFQDNIPKTCGQPGCHPGANANFANGKMHVDPESRDAGIIYWAALFFKWLTILTLVALIAHIILDLFRRARVRKIKK